MGTTYEYNYEYEVADNNKNRSPVNDNTGHFPRQTQHGVAAAHTSRTNMMDSLAALQHDRIWHKLYDPLELDRTVHEAEIQVCNRIFFCALKSIISQNFYRHFMSLSEERKKTHIRSR
jgi:hypothetical protein